jgi:hypothetical protein
MSFRYRDLISCDANHRISRWDWLGSRWLLPLSLAGFLATWGQEAAGAMIYEASFCSPNCKTETDFETTITFSGLPQSFTSDGTNFVQSFAGSFTVNPVGSPLKNGTITNLQYIADANHDKFDGITSNGPYLFLRGLNEDTKEGAELYFAFRLSVPLAQASPTVAFFPIQTGTIRRMARLLPTLPTYAVKHQRAMKDTMARRIASLVATTLACRQVTMI